MEMSICSFDEGCLLYCFCLRNLLGFSRICEAGNLIYLTLFMYLKQFVLDLIVNRYHDLSERGRSEFFIAVFPR